MTTPTLTPEITSSPAPAELEFENVSTHDLRSMLAEAIGLTEKTIVRMAMIWGELRRRGEDLSDVRLPFAQYLDRVASGSLRPNLMVMMAGQPRALGWLAELPLTDQDMLASGNPVEILTEDGPRKKSLRDMTLSEIGLVVRDGVIRSVTEQKIAIDRANRSARPRNVAGRPVTITIRDGIMTVGRSQVNLDRVLAALRRAGIITDHSINGDIA